MSDSNWSHQRHRVQGSSMLVERYGYFPSLHDARILDFYVNAQSNEVSVLFYVYDLPDEGYWKQDWDRNLHTIVEIKWHDVQEFNLYFAENYIYEMQLFEESGFLKTLFFIPTDFGYGSIVSRSISVERVELVKECSKHNDSGYSVREFCLRGQFAQKIV